MLARVQIMNKAAALRQYVTLAHQKTRLDAEVEAARIALFEVHGYAYCLPGDPRRLSYDQEVRDGWLSYKIAGFGVFTRDATVVSTSRLGQTRMGETPSVKQLLEHGHFTKEQVEEARRLYAADVERLSQRQLQRPVVFIPNLKEGKRRGKWASHPTGWRNVSEAWQHLWRTIPRLADLSLPADEAGATDPSIRPRRTT